MIFWIIVYILSCIIATLSLMVYLDADSDQDKELCFCLGVIWPIVLVCVIGTFISVQVVKLLGRIADNIRRIS